MNRPRRNMVNKQFLSGGVYNPNAQQTTSTGSSGSVLAAVPPASAMSSGQPGGSQSMDVSMANQPIIKAENMSCVNEAGKSSGIVVYNNDGTANPFNLPMEIEIGSKIPFKKIFQKRKKSSERTRDKKVRQNRQLRKSMLPKNALMALNEVKGINISDFTINTNPDGGFTAIVTVNSRQYEGKGPSKMTAKNLACEKALRDYIIAKMTPKPKKAQKTHAENESMDTESSDNPAEDEVPMLNLASFAIYKLFAEWEREGYIIPEMHPAAGLPSAQHSDPNSPSSTLVVLPKEPKKPTVRTELPANWETMHPATLLCVMRPGLSYVDHGCIGEKPNVMQRLGVTVDNQEFAATGRSKKIARRNVAVNVCNTLFNTNFTYEEY